MSSPTLDRWNTLMRAPKVRSFNYRLHHLPPVIKAKKFATTTALRLTEIPEETGLSTDQKQYTADDKIGRDHYHQTNNRIH